MSTINNENIFAVICEFNPFHLGHSYLINESRKNTGSKYCIALMSGDYVQRGEPAVFDKYTRTRMALMNGIDLVIELPTIYATASAEGFAKGAVSLLNSLNCVDYLSFGSENGNIKELMDMAYILNNPSPEDDARMRELIKSGISYPKARDIVFGQYDVAKDIISAPNNILAVEYIRALLSLGSSITPFTTERKSLGYNSDYIDENAAYCSALSIRNCISRNNNAFTGYVPENSLKLYSEKPVFINDFSDVIYYSLSSKSPEELSEYLDVNTELSHKIVKNLCNYKTAEDFIDLLKSKNITRSRISRALIHIVLGITVNPVETVPTYARILGFRKEAAPLLTTLKEKSDISIISKLKDYGSTPELDIDIKGATLYEQIRRTYQNEYSSQIVII